MTMALSTNASVFFYRETDALHSRIGPLSFRKCPRRNIIPAAELKGSNFHYCYLIKSDTSLSYSVVSLIAVPSEN